MRKPTKKFKPPKKPPGLGRKKPPKKPPGLGSKKPPTRPGGGPYGPGPRPIMPPRKKKRPKY